MMLKINEHPIYNIILSVLPYIGMAAILFNGAEPFEKILNTLSTESLMQNLVKIAKTISERKTFKNKLAAVVASIASM